MFTKFLLSKWFWYGLIATILLSITFYLSYFAFNGNDLALRFLPTLASLSTTLLIFTVFFELRERLEFKSIETEVKEKIGMHIFDVFNEIAKLCVCPKVTLDDNENFEDFRKKLVSIQLPELKKKIEFNELGKKYLLDDRYSDFFKREENYLDNVETKYSRLLNSNIIKSLMNLQAGLHSIYLTLKTAEKTRVAWGMSEDDHFEILSNDIKRVISEIEIMKNLGIPI